MCQLKSIFAGILILAASLLGQVLVKNNSFVYNNNAPSTYISVGPNINVYCSSGFTNGNTVNFYSYYPAPSPLELYTTPAYSFKRPSFSKSYSSVTFTQSWADADSGWELLFSYYESNVTKFALVDDNGTTILSDTGSASFTLYDGSTYLISTFSVDYGTTTDSLISMRQKIWKFRSGIIGVTQPSLSKSAINQNPELLLTQMGTLRINMQETNTGEISIRIFDLRGRLTYSDKVSSLKNMATIYVPAAGLPKSPFIANIEQGSFIFSKKEIPLK